MTTDDPNESESSDGTAAGAVSLVRGCPMQWRAWSHDELKTLKRLAGTMPAREIAVAMGRSHESVKQCARFRRIKLWQRGEKHSAAKYPDSAVECSRCLHGKGWSAERISAAYGWPVGTIKSWIYYIARRNDPVKVSRP